VGKKRNLPNIDGLVKSPTSVTPVKTGVQNLLNSLDSGFRRNDEKRTKQTFYETINIDEVVKIQNRLSIVIPAKAGIRAPASRCDQRGESPLSGDARS
jgi:hypothetical protein